MSLRNSIETRLKALPECYMKGVKVGAQVNRQQCGGQGRVRPNARDQNFLFLSPFGDKGLATHDEGSGGTSRVGYVAYFWAVMLTDRDNQQLVNMHPYQDEYQMPHPVAKCFSMNFSAAMKITLPFVTNNKDLQVGDLLVLPFDGDFDEIFWVPHSQSASSSGYEPTSAPSD